MSKPLTFLQYLNTNHYTHLCVGVCVMAALCIAGVFGSEPEARIWCPVFFAALVALVLGYARRSYRRHYLPSAARRK